MQKPQRLGCIEKHTPQGDANAANATGDILMVDQGLGTIAGNGLICYSLSHYDNRIECLENTSVDLIFMLLQISELNGFHALKNIRSKLFPITGKTIFFILRESFYNLLN